MREIPVDELRKIQLSILDGIDSFCQTNSIEYYLFAGTLIGCVRHQGFIPWDDDIDICMKREDYEFFFSNFNKTSANFKAICFENSTDYYSASGKVIDTRTILIENISIDYSIGVYVDVFPMDNLPDNIKKIRKLNNRIKVYRNMLTLKTVKTSADRVWYKNFLLIVSSFLLKPMSIKKILTKINELAQMYRNSLDSGFIADISVLTYGEKEIFPKEWFSSSVKMEFEGKMYSSPASYDLILSKMYGDYMSLPSEDKRVSHHSFKAYWKEGEKI